MLFTLAFWQGAGERGLKTFAQSLVAIIGVGTLGLLDVDWPAALSVAALAAVVSLLTSVGNADFTSGVEAGDRFVDEDDDGYPDLYPSND